MKNKELYIIAGCNGAGKTTASFNILPSRLECKEYVNADEIARGLSPFQPEKVSFEAGRIMLHRIQELMAVGENFAFETTLATKSFVNLITTAKQNDYRVTLLYLWIASSDLAKQRVKARVAAGGHSIPEEVIERRYYRGLKNLFELYHNICDSVFIFDNSDNDPVLLYEKKENIIFTVHNEEKFNQIKSLAK